MRRLVCQEAVSCARSWHEKKSTRRECRVIAPVGGSAVCLGTAPRWGCSYPLNIIPAEAGKRQRCLHLAVRHEGPKQWLPSQNKSNSALMVRRCVGFPRALRGTRQDTWKHTLRKAFAQGWQLVLPQPTQSWSSNLEQPSSSTTRNLAAMLAGILVAE